MTSCADYVERNRERMQYADFRAQGLTVGSGVVEAGCKTTIGARLKVRHALDRRWSQRHHCTTLLLSQRPFRGLLGESVGQRVMYYLKIKNLTCTREGGCRSDRARL